MKCKLVYFIASILILGVLTKLKKKDCPPWKANLSDIREEFLTQATANNIYNKGLTKTNIDSNPSRYDIIHPSNLERGTIYEKDKEAYYPYVDPKKTNLRDGVPHGLTPEAKSRYGSYNIYPLDQKPYYGQGDYVINQEQAEKVSVPIQMGDLTLTHASPTNLAILESKLRQLNASDSITDVNVKQKYAKDSEPYYDPAKEDREAQKRALMNAINDMRNELMNPSIPEFEERKVKYSQKVQNYQNMNRETSNKMIVDSYHYDVVKDENSINHAFPKAELKNPTMIVSQLNRSDSSKYSDNTIVQVEVDTVEGPLASKYVQNGAQNTKDAKQTPSPRVESPSDGKLPTEELKKEDKTQTANSSTNESAQIATKRVDGETSSELKQEKSTDIASSSEAPVSQLQERVAPNVDSSTNQSDGGQMNPKQEQKANQIETLPQARTEDMSDHVENA